MSYAFDFEDRSTSQLRKKQSTGKSMVMWVVAGFVGLLIGAGSVAGVILVLNPPRTPHPPTFAGNTVATEAVTSSAQSTNPKPVVVPTSQPNKNPLQPIASPKAVNRHGEWEKKSRAKLEEGLDLLKRRMTDKAIVTIAYAFADVPAPTEMSRSQLEMMTEISFRLGVISTVTKDKEMMKKYMTYAELRRKDLGWNIDKYKEWNDELLVDTCARMGIKE